MNCSDVTPILDHLMRDPASQVVDQTALREHLTKCASCQRALNSLARWDGQLSVAMNDVKIPTDLSQRLLDELSSSESVSGPVTVPPKPLNKWRRTFTSTIVVGLVCLAVWWTWIFVKRPMLSQTDVASLLQLPLVNLPEADESGQILPRQWLALKKDGVITGSGKKMVLSEFALTVVVFPLDVRTGQGPPVSGALFVVPKARWSSAAANATIVNSVVSYAPPNVWMAWTEKNVVYILALNGQSHLLEQLRKRLGGNNAIL